MPSFEEMAKGYHASVKAMNEHTEKMTEARKLAEPHNMKVRFRERREASPKEGLRQSWTEYQLLKDRKIIQRFEHIDAVIWYLQKM